MTNSTKNFTMKFCPYCGSASVRVRYEGNYRGHLGKFMVECTEGHVTDCIWPDDDHDEDCACSLHDCVVCGATTHNVDQVCDKQDCQNENEGK